MTAGTAAVVVNYRTADKTVAAVRALQASTSRPSAIIVVDNGSGDGSSSRIAATLHDIHVIEEPVNGGFSAGCNAGIREALRRGATRVLLLNSDALVSPAAVGEMERLIESDARLGVAGPILLSMNPREQIESFGIRYSRASGRMWNLDFGKKLSAVDRPARRDVDAVSGCAMLLKRSVFERVGLFHEDYFFGFEDIDFCIRARAAGFETAVTGNAIVEHEGQASLGQASPRRIYFAARNHLLLSGRNPVPASFWSRWLRTGSILSLNLTHALFSSDVRRMDGLRAYVNGVQDHFSGRYGAGRQERG